MYFLLKFQKSLPISSRYQIIDIVTCNTTLKIHKQSPTILDLLFLFDQN
jgi:hypothetical protein